MSLGGFGRRISPDDPRDLQFRMRAAIPQIDLRIGRPAPRLGPYRERPPLNQGQTPQCVGYSGRGFLNAAPMMSRPDFPPTATELYNAARRNDEWPGEDYDGSSVRGLMKAMQAAGLISSYVWGQTVTEALIWMNGGYGTVIIGSWWYPSMDNIDSDGYIVEPSATATPVDGHAYRLNWSPHAGAILVVNSWGHVWGKPLTGGRLSGMAYMRPRLLERLLREQGEIAAPTQVKISAVLT